MAPQLESRARWRRKPSNNAIASSNRIETTALDLVGVEPVCDPAADPSGAPKTSCTSLSAPRTLCANRRPSRVRSARVSTSPISSSASRTVSARLLAGAQMPSHRDIECAGPAVLRGRSGAGRARTGDRRRRCRRPRCAARRASRRHGGCRRVACSHRWACRSRPGRRTARPVDRSFPTGRSESFENVLEGAVGDELLGELVAAGPHLALNDAVLGEPVLATQSSRGE